MLIWSGGKEAQEQTDRRVLKRVWQNLISFHGFVRTKENAQIWSFGKKKEKIKGRREGQGNLWIQDTSSTVLNMIILISHISFQILLCIISQGILQWLHYFLNGLLAERGDRASK